MTVGYCSRCGTRMALTDVAGKPREQCPACGQIAWRNPVPVGLAVIEHQGQLVLIRRSAAPLANYWAPPAGYVECGESVPDAIKREAREESGLDIELQRLIGVFSQPDVDVLIVAYAAQSVGGQLIAGDDACEAALFTHGRLPTQTAPVGGSATDHWFFGVIRELTTSWHPQ